MFGSFGLLPAPGLLTVREQILPAYACITQHDSENEAEKPTHALLLPTSREDHSGHAPGTEQDISACKHWLFRDFMPERTPLPKSSCCICKNSNLAFEYGLNGSSGKSVRNWRAGLARLPYP